MEDKNVTQRGFAYKVYQEGMPEPTTSDKTRSVSLEAETFSVQISDLQAKTKYIVRAFAINKAGTGYGEGRHFHNRRVEDSSTDMQHGHLLRLLPPRLLPPSAPTEASS